VTSSKIRAAKIVAAALVVAVALAGCGSASKTGAASNTTARSTAPTVPVIKPGTKPVQVALTAGCAKAVAPADKMIRTMHSGAVLTAAETRSLNRVLSAGPKACAAAEYSEWQYKYLLPWMRMPPTSMPTVTPAVPARHQPAVKTGKIAKPVKVTPAAG
jgi:hypothetical protein